MVGGKPEKGKKAPEKGDKGRHKEKVRTKVLVRVLDTDIDGEKGVAQAILKIKGVSHSFANAICKAANIDPKRKLGSFTESEINELEDVIKEPGKYGVPDWVVNRRKDT